MRRWAARAELYEPGSDGVLWWSDYTDEARHRPEAGLLDRCRASGTCPKIVETFGSFEFWGLRASPDLVGTDADRDIPLPRTCGAITFPASRMAADAAASARNRPRSGGCELARQSESFFRHDARATTALIDWVTKNTPPPPSQYPRLDRGELVVPTQAALGSP